MKTSHKIFTNYFLGSFLCFFTAFHLTTIAHEIAGHGLAAKAMGARITDIYISWMGGAGYVKWDKSFTGLQGLIANWAGIGVTLLIGAGLWYLWRRNFKDACWSGVFLWIVALTMVSSALGYTVLGLHYIYSDTRVTALWLQAHYMNGLAVWAGMFLHGGILWFFCRHLVYLQAKWIDFKSTAAHIMLALVVLGGSAGAVAGLNRIESFTREKAEHKEIMKKESRRKAEVAVAQTNIKRKEQGKPVLSDKETRQAIKQKTEELAPWPIWWVYIPLLLIGICAGAHRGGMDRPEIKRPSVIPLWLWLAAAGSIVLSGILSAF